MQEGRPVVIAHGEHEPHDLLEHGGLGHDGRRVRGAVTDDGGSHDHGQAVHRHLAVVGLGDLLQMKDEEGEGVAVGARELADGLKNK